MSAAALLASCCSTVCETTSAFVQPVFLPEKRFHQQVDHVAERHVSGEPAQEPECLAWLMRELVEVQLAHLLRADAVDRLA
jgi:hypothetical protein